MRRVVSAADVEAVAGNGERRFVVSPDDVITPLARDRALALGVGLDGDRPPAPAPVGEGADGQGNGALRSPASVARLAAESRVRMVARRHLLRAGRGLDDLDVVVAAVIRRVKDGGGCLCGGSACERGGAG